MKEEVDSAEEGDEAVAPLQITPDLVEDHMDEGEEAKEQEAEDSRDMVVGFFSGFLNTLFVPRKDTKCSSFFHY